MVARDVTSSIAPRPFATVEEPSEAKPFTLLFGFELRECSESVIVVRLIADPMDLNLKNIDDGPCRKWDSPLLLEERESAKITIGNVESFRGNLVLRDGDLPYGIWDVFSREMYEQSSDPRIVPVESLVSPKNELRDPKFISGDKRDPRQTAFDRMRETAQNRLVGREPLSVRRLAEGMFEIIDGNATAQVLMLVGWRDVPVAVIKN